MSEYQGYEFLAVDRPLSKEQMAELRQISTRAEITTTRFSNEYHYGNLKADPEDLLERYFDVHVYVSNWGTHTLGLRLPADVVTEEEGNRYLTSEHSHARSAGAHTILWLQEEAEDYEESDAHEWMGALAGVRAALMQGDQRPLYLAWLHAVNNKELSGEDEEPPVPPGLGALSGPLEALVEFLFIDEHLVTVAAQESASHQPETGDVAQWIAQLPPTEKDALLLEVMQGEHARVCAALNRRFRAAEAPLGAKPQRRTVAQLLERAAALREEATRRAAAAAAEARRRREALDAAAKAKRLDALSGRSEAAWRDAEQLASTKIEKSYKEAVKLLVDLRDLAQREGRLPGFMSRFARFTEAHTRKRTFIAMLHEAGLR